MSEHDTVELNIDIIRKLIKTSHPTFSNLFDIFNIKQKNNESPSELLDRIRSEVNSSNSPEVSIDNLNTIIAINSLSDPVLKDKLITFKCENEHSNIEDIATIINKDMSSKTINNYQHKSINTPSQSPKRKKEGKESTPPPKPKVNKKVNHNATV